MAFRGAFGPTFTNPFPITGVTGPVVLFYATFTAADGTLIQNYTPEIGNVMQQAPLLGASQVNCIISSNRATLAPGGTADRGGAVADMAAAVRLTATVRMPFVTVTAAGLYLRRVDANNYWRTDALTDTNILRISETSAGITTTRASVAKSIPAGATLTNFVGSVDAANLFTVAWDGATATYTSALHAGETKHGLYTLGSSIAANVGWIDNLTGETI